MSARTLPARRPRTLAAAALTLLVWITYGGALGNDLVFDDAIFMERDERVRSIAGAARLFREPLWGFVDAPGQPGIHQYYRPLQQLPLVVSSVWFDASPTPAHLLSLALHAGNAALAFVLLTSLGAGPAAAFLLAALFACHPALSESVLWVADTAGLGATMCTLLCVLLHARRGQRRHGGLGVWSGPPLVAALTLAGAWFKESGVFIPAFMLVYDLLPGRRERPSGQGPQGSARLAGRAQLADYIAAGLGLTVYFTLRVDALGGVLPGSGQLALSARELIVNAFALLPAFVRTFAWPFDLNMYHDFEPATGVSDLSFLAGLLIAAAVAAALAMTWRRRPVAAFGLVWATLATAPFLLVRWPQLNVFAERYLYMPVIGAIIVAAAVVSTEPRPSARFTRLASVAAVGLIFVFVLTGRARVRDWADEETLYTKTLTQSARAELVRNNLALRYLALDRPGDGIRIQRELLAIDPDFPSGWHNLGLLLLAAGDDAAAVTAFEESRAREPRNAATLLNLGYAYDRVGRREDAVVAYFRTVAEAPWDARPWYNLAVIALEIGRLESASRAVRRVLELEPGDHDAVALTRGIERRMAERGLAEPGTAGSKSAATATAASASPETERRCAAGRAAAEAGRYADATAILNAAAWYDARAALPHHYLANVYYLQGLYEQALVHQRTALERAPGNRVYAANLASLQALVEARREDAGD